MLNRAGFEKVVEEPKNNTAVRVFISRMFAYSARKNNAKGPPAYSTLKPETNSDSPSVRSKGARLVSASVEINHIDTSGQAGRISQTFSCRMLKAFKEKFPEKITAHNKMRPRLTS